MIRIILANLNIDNSDSVIAWKKANECAEEQDYSKSTNTKEQNSQNEPYYKIVELTSNGRLKGFFVSENVANRKVSNKADVHLLSKGLNFVLHLILLINQS